jgi:uncharacterized protein DUF4242
MPRFMDVHHGMVGISPTDLMAAHKADLDIQEQEGVSFKQAWGDPSTGVVFCLSEGPSKEAVMKIHERAGHPTTEVYEVPIEA